MEGKGRVEKEGERKGRGEELEEAGNRMTKMEEGQRGEKGKKYLD